MKQTIWIPSILALCLGLSSCGAPVSANGPKGPLFTGRTRPASSDLAAGLKPGEELVYDFDKGFWSDVGDAIGDAVDDTGDWIDGAVDDTGNAISDGYNAFWNGVDWVDAKGAKYVFNPVGNAGDTAGNAVDNALYTAANGFNSGVNSAFNGIYSAYDGVSSAYDSVANWSTNLYDTSYSGTINGFNYVVKKSKDGTLWFFNRSDAATSVRSFITSAITGFRNAWSTTMNYFTIQSNCTTYSANPEKYLLSKTGYFNPMTPCTNTQDGNGYFLFGTTAGSNVPIWQQTVYIATNDDETHSFTVALKDQQIENFKLNLTQTATGPKTNADLPDSKFATMLNATTSQVEGWINQIYAKVGPFAVVAAYDVETGIYNLYVLKKSGTASLLSNSTITALTKVFANYNSSDYAVYLSEGSSLKNAFTSQKGNWFVFHYLFGTHKVTIDHN
ncbi:MAG: hypothetical protein ACAI44_37075 [Candidatus Sericytochromatia bacterium]